MVNSKEALLWSIALPGFGQILNGRLLKGIVLILLEILINVQASFNKAIVASFNGEIEAAIQYVDYQWLMFYPCLYFYSIWDAYKDAGGATKSYSYLPFVFSAYFVTLGLIYSAKLTIFGTLLGPVWLPMLFTIPGLLTGFTIMYIIRKIQKQKRLQ